MAIDRQAQELATRQARGAAAQGRPETAALQQALASIQSAISEQGQIKWQVGGASNADVEYSNLSWQGGPVDWTFTCVDSEHSDALGYRTYNFEIQLSEIREVVPDKLEIVGIYPVSPVVYQIRLVKKDGTELTFVFGDRSRAERVRVAFVNALQLYHALGGSF